MADKIKIPFGQLLLQYSNTALNIIFPLILFPYMTRTLGPSGYGVIGFYESMMTVVIVLAGFGVNYYGLRLLSKSAIGDTDQSNTVLHLLLINTIMAVSGMAVYLVYVLNKPVQIGGREITWLYAYIMTIYMFHADWYFQSQEKFRFLLQRTFILRLFVLVSSFIFVRNPAHLIHYIIISAINYTLIAGSAWWNMREIFSHWKWDPALFRRLLAALLPFAFLGVLSSLYFTVDTILLARTGKVADIGQYTVAAKIVRLGLNVFVGASIVFFVRLFRSAVDKDLQSQSLLMMLHLSIPIGALLFFFASPVIRFVVGDNYLPAINILHIFALLWVVVPLHDFFNIQVLMVHHREKLLVAIYAAATAVSFLLNLVLIPVWFTTGAAIAVLITECGVLVASILYSRQYFKISLELARELIVCLSAFPLALLCSQVAIIASPTAYGQLAIGLTGFAVLYLLLQLVIFRNAFWLKIWSLVQEKLTPSA
ncbi:oligosaccharide flippase family protein [Flavihumibacter profundi]|uniref:oligosaccharide flippase family protein n=1 Tax=Flavihumibacter profundi TaxID=2716883 RepID=UPI001CC375A9|nr:oligosaccharide flippase family protein [Flavihumibacter profundi]MBZ5856235.1 oligosaccharide flippase family protein [Flavihumibacter profundi]